MASAKLQHIQFLCCLKKSQLKVLYCHVISSMTKYQQASDVAAYQDTPRKGLYIPLKRASIYPSKGPLHYPQKGLYVPLKRASTYPSKGPSHTPQKGPHVPVACSSRLVMRCLRAMPSLPFTLYALCCRRAAALPAGWPATRASRVAPCTAGDT